MSITSEVYNNRGVSSTKDDVHKAISNLYGGIFTKTFCKVYPDYLTGDPNYCIISHADGSGTKSILSYLYYKLTNDLSIWSNLAKDSIVMNTDDLLCVGAIDNFIYTSTIGRNKNLINGDVISELINGTSEYIKDLSNLGFNINLMGGETADVGDVVRTIIVDGSMTTRLKKSDVVDNSNIKPGDVIIGFSSYGQSTYESEYNSGIGSNGLTSARHDLLNKYYEINFPESFDPNVDPEYRFIGKYSLLDTESSTKKTIGELLLSPTRTYLPVVKDVFESIPRNEIHGIIHCTGGGQTKILNFVDNLHIVKDDLFEIPPIFKLIYEETNASLKEMYQVFNMGHRLEIYASEEYANTIISISKRYNINAKIIGRVEKSDSKKLTLITQDGELKY